MVYASDLQPRKGSNSIYLRWTLPQSSFDLEYDSDGDLVRSVKSHELYYSVQCDSECTDLDSVGDQLWNGALFLGCYLVENPFLVEGIAVLELACGVGALGGLYQALCVQRAVLTDFSRAALSLCDTNNVDNDKVAVRRLDFKDPDTYFDALDEDIGLILAADVWYDFAINDAFGDALFALLSRFSRAEAILCCEERLNIVHPAIPPCDVFAQDFFDKFASGDNARFSITELQPQTDIVRHLSLAGGPTGSLLRHCKLYEVSLVLERSSH
ncbi:conserved hypothetical protein [Perkinsus marinus ATCC 50983]|uniref:Uncharacterized protein n=2 Tax=Perkinsus marinus (strain ATCC 50983 / TXsc) TaxID=423536 RepID=C5L6J0_PERM5|nr:conserved hypothetical protein [Perkinsus marinus ATCC 50983]EER07651.1 conserved hypothetical protein [Perkinsus marinus ATCC 50983]|eukprot:XP_002775835.1 conserved hypothetical protein [Perkinsus marinus ATCC 50983]